VLHTHGYLPDLLAASLGFQVGFARVSTAHGFTGGGWRNQLYEWMQRLSYVRFDAVVAVSEKLKLDLVRATSSRRRVYALANGWSPALPLMSPDSAREVLGIAKDSFNVAWVGRVSREKALDVLIEALPALRDLPLHLTVIGDGAERSNLERRATELRIAHSISWRGEVSRASCLFPAFDLFVNSSRTEGTPITLFEAMHAGVAIVATAVGGVPDVISSREAILIPSEDSAALASAIRRVYDAPDEASDRAGRARERLDDFGYTAWLEAYESIYRSAIAASVRK
jgi:glycosyltransferase involved in cell wall biosynthesis